MKRIAVLFALGLAVAGSAGAFGADADPARHVKELQAKIKELESRVAELKTKLEAEGDATADGKPKPPGEKALALDQPLDDRQQAAADKAQAKVARLEAAMRKRLKKLSGPAEQNAKTAAADWAGASAALIGLLAKYGQASSCQSALAKFHAGRNVTDESARAFEQAAYRSAVTFADEWRSPDAAMRIAASYGPKSRDLPETWGKLCDRCAASAGKREYKALALKCYLRAVVIDTRRRAAWKRVRELEAELKPPP